MCNNLRRVGLAVQEHEEPDEIQSVSEAAQPAKVAADSETPQLLPAHAGFPVQQRETCVEDDGQLLEG